MKNLGIMDTLRSTANWMIGGVNCAASIVRDNLMRIFNRSTSEAKQMGSDAVENIMETFKSKISENSETISAAIKAATKIQSVYRGGVVRSKAAKETKAATKIQSVCRGGVVRLKAAKEAQAAKKGQAAKVAAESAEKTVLLLKDRSEAEIIEERLLKAIIHEQCPPSPPCPVLKRMIESRNQAAQAATKIQSVCRGGVVRLKAAQAAQEAQAAQKAQAAQEAQAAQKAQAAQEARIAKAAKEGHESQEKNLRKRMEKYGI